MKNSNTSRTSNFLAIAAAIAAIMMLSSLSPTAGAAAVQKQPGSCQKYSSGGDTCAHGGVCVFRYGARSVTSVCECGRVTCEEQPRKVKLCDRKRQR